MTDNNKKLTTPLIDIDEAASILGMHKSTLYGIIRQYEAIKNKKFQGLPYKDKIFNCPPYIRIGKRLKFTRESLQGFIDDSLREEKK